MTQETQPDSRKEFDPTAPITGNWFRPFRGQQVLELGLAGDYDSIGGITGALSLEGPSKGQMRIRYIEVFSEDDRGKGLGRRFLQTFAAEAKHAGATALVGDIISVQELHNRVQTFGEGNVSFYEERPAADGSSGKVVELPLTREQAVQSLLRAHQVDEDATISTRTDLTVVDTSGWELPIIKDESKRPNIEDQLATPAHAVGGIAVRESHLTN